MFSIEIVKEGNDLEKSKEKKKKQHLASIFC